MHGATEVDGKMQIAEVWESEQYAQRYDDEHLAPAIAAAGLPDRAVDVTIIDLQHLVTP